MCYRYNKLVILVSHICIISVIDKKYERSLFPFSVEASQAGALSEERERTCQTSSAGERRA